MLSTKLVNAINHQTSLDDILQATRHELDAAREQIIRLDAAAEEHQRLLDQGLLVRRKDVEKMERKLAADIAEERNQRAAAENERKSIEQELENLSAALFEEANQVCC